MPAGLFTEPTTGYWQELTADVPARFSAAPPYRFGYPVRLPDGRVLMLPLRQLPTDDLAVASLIANQASHPVLAALADHMAALARSFEAEIIVGIRASFGTTMRCRSPSVRSRARTSTSGYGSIPICCR
jgi:hypothetical protein